MGISKPYTTERNKKTPKEVEGTFHDYGSAPRGTFSQTEYRRAAHFENIKPHNPPPEDWCIPADMEEGDYLMMNCACEVNEKGTRGKNDGNEDLKKGSSPPLDLDSNRVIEANEESYPRQKRTGKTPNKWNKQNLEPDLPFATQTRQSDRTRLTRKYNPCRDDFVVDRMDLKKMGEELVGLEEITVSQDIDIVDDHDEEWIDDRSKPKVEFDDEQHQSYEQDLTILRVLNWLDEMTSARSRPVS